MASLDQMATLSADLGDVTTLATNDLYLVWTDARSADPAVVRDTLLDVVPGITRDYAALSAELSTQWYADLDVSASFTPTPAPPPPTEQIEATIRWAVSPLFGVGDASTLELLSGGVQRHIVNTSRETLLDNTSREKGARWARHASATACAWCRVLATRDPVYRSRAAALASHDNCKCLANVVRPGQDYQRPFYVDRWEQQYKDAREEVGGAMNDIVNHLRRTATR